MWYTSLMEINALRKQVEELAFDLDSDVFRCVVDVERASIMERVATEIGLPFKRTGTVGSPYSFLISGSGVAHGVLKEGKTIVQIAYGENPTAMSDFWTLVEASSSSKKAS